MTYHWGDLYDWGESGGQQLKLVLDLAHPFSKQFRPSYISLETFETVTSPLILHTLVPFTLSRAAWASVLGLWSILPGSLDWLCDSLCLEHWGWML
jgi:hypothetical protein